MLDLRRLRLLRELARRGTIAAVAQALSYSPSAVSQQLAALEKEAGVRLLEPAGRRVRLTAQADLLVAHTQVLLEDMERAQAALARSLNQTAGTPRVAAFQTAVLALVPHALSHLERQHPSLRVELTELEPDAALPALVVGEFGLALGEEYPDSRGLAPARPSVTTCSPTNSGYHPGRMDRAVTAQPRVAPVRAGTGRHRRPGMGDGGMPASGVRARRALHLYRPAVPPATR
jgi:DNA-binding transcriptional LysR family regulator